MKPKLNPKLLTLAERKQLLGLTETQLDTGFKDDNSRQMGRESDLINPKSGLRVTAPPIAEDLGHLANHNERRTAAGRAGGHASTVRRRSHSGGDRLAPFWAACWQRGVNAPTLAIAAGLSVRWLQRVLLGARKGQRARQRIAALLTQHELAALGWHDVSHYKGTR